MASLIVVDYGAGNRVSVVNAFRALGIEAKPSADPGEIRNADRVVFPGVGAAASAMERLSQTGIAGALRAVVESGKPLLGICLGCQIILDESEEDGGTKTLGLISGRAVRFKEEKGIKIPHMGWNQVSYPKMHPIFKNIKSGSDFYFVHSYYPQVSSEFVFGETVYGTQKFPSLIGKDNLIAAQFHLEKSGDAGLEVLKNFSRWDGKC
ncbi:MAG: imidazole glycerol phosphate synthase subunit HisH [Fibrobacter sp.]|jgi:glutamine amidotransferase|nr:imidazole glycerol phosphate synthase subunit HisH [Fibrobacter sp.]